VAVRPAGRAGRRCRDAIGADELIECDRQLLAERRHAQHRVDVGEVVVHPRAVRADDRSERAIHRREPAARHAKREAQVAEVVVIAN
jgi:hypothetical protein